jgi:hypothetical protein
MENEILILNSVKTSENVAWHTSTNLMGKPRRLGYCTPGFGSQPKIAINEAKFQKFRIKFTNPGTWSLVYFPGLKKDK